VPPVWILHRWGLPNALNALIHQDHPVGHCCCCQASANGYPVKLGQRCHLFHRWKTHNVRRGEKEISVPGCESSLGYMGTTVSIRLISGIICWESVGLRGCINTGGARRSISGKREIVVGTAFEGTWGTHKRQQYCKPGPCLKEAYLKQPRVNCCKSRHSGFKEEEQMLRLGWDSAGMGLFQGYYLMKEQQF